MATTERIVPTPDTTDVIEARIGAQLIDVAILYVQILTVAIVLLLLARPQTRAGLTPIIVVSFLTLPLYGAILESRWNGQTVGKRLTGVKVVGGAGRTPNFGEALLRNVPALLIHSWVTAAVALAAIATSDRRQRLFDRAAETYVVDVPDAGRLRQRS